MKIPRIVIAGTQSGVGKTSVALAIMTALREAGHRVQPFKVGPDYIDPGYHRLVTGRPSHNLDSWMIGREKVGRLFEKYAEPGHIAVIEGVMGLYDGFGSRDETASTAEIAKLLQAPVLLVLDGRSLARSAAAVVSGYKNFDPGVSIAGVILNRVAGTRHRDLLAEAIEHYTGVPVWGVLPRDARIQIPERHLGLETAQENETFRQCRDALLEITRPDLSEKGLGIGLSKIVAAAQSAPPLEIPGLGGDIAVPSPPEEARVAIGIARDRAFQFYYEANLDLLEAFGAELVSFSPLEDSHLPPSVSALYFGGGFPELYAEGLQANQAMKESVRQRVGEGLPVYAECGGLMYLSEGIEDLSGKSFEMVGVVPGTFKMAERLQNFGYAEGSFCRDTLLADEGTPVRGHEFHYSYRDRDPDSDAAYRIHSRRSPAPRLEGFARASVLASYLHLHFWCHSEWAKRLIQAASKYRMSRMSTPAVDLLK